MDDANNTPELRLREASGGVLRISVEGDWTLRRTGPGADVVENALEENPDCTILQLEFSELGDWDTTLLCLVDACRELCEERQMTFRTHSLPDGIRRLLELSRSVLEKEDVRQNSGEAPMLHRLGERALTVLDDIRDLLTFLGESLWAFGKLTRGQAQFRWSDAFLVMQRCGPQALGVVALINFLVGLILAFVGAIQLTQFGASVYVADLVAIGTVREMSSVMTGIILCGRTGAAFAAQLGTMKVNEEIDAFRTFGISPIEFLVLPRLLALVLMMPLLCVFADLISITGGYLVSVSILDITSTEYIDRTIAAITLKSFLLGIVKGAFFGFLVALTGCWRGMQCGSNAAAVGEATTAAVVAGITSIVAADGVFAILCNALNI